MFTFKILCFGKLKTPGTEALTFHYTKLLKRYANLEVIELKPYSGKSQNLSEILTHEKLKLGPHLDSSLPTIVLDDAAKSKSTHLWSEFWKDQRQLGHQTFIFILGSSFGLHPEIIKKARLCISFGPQTLPHELARIVLIEQLFRSLSYLHQHPYHHASRLDERLT